MPLFERDASKHKDTSVDPQRNAASSAAVSVSAPVSVSDAEESAAHIAELVRRTAERQARPGPSSVLSPDVSAAGPPLPPLPAPPVPQRREEPLSSRFRLALPSRRIMVAVGAVAAVLIAGGFALSDTGGSDATSTTAASAAPAGYAVKVTDVITDCASHSRGQTRTLFETQSCDKATRSLATGQVSGRPALFVSSRIQMASVEAAASLKQVLDGTGTGNLNDLLREGKTFPGAPAAMPSSGYASVQSGSVVLVAEAGFNDGGPSSNSSPALRAAAAQVAALAPTAN